MGQLAYNGRHLRCLETRGRSEHVDQRNRLASTDRDKQTNAINLRQPYNAIVVCFGISAAATRTGYCATGLRRSIANAVPYILYCPRAVQCWWKGWDQWGNGAAFGFSEVVTAFPVLTIYIAHFGHRYRFRYTPR